MAQEADFYSAEEAAKVLEVPVRRVFSMLCSGELEGHQDEWARWRVSASAVQNTQRSRERPSSQNGLPVADAGSRHATDETLVLDAAATTVLSTGGPLAQPPGGTASASDDETTQGAVEAPIGGGPTLRKREESGGTEAGKGPLAGDYEEPAGPDAASSDKVTGEIAEQLAAAVAKTRELRDRLELAEATEATLRESLERERQRAEQEGVEAAGQQRGAAERGEGSWRRRFFGG